LIITFGKIAFGYRFRISRSYANRAGWSVMQNLHTQNYRCN